MILGFQPPQLIGSPFQTHLPFSLFQELPIGGGSSGEEYEAGEVRWCEWLPGGAETMGRYGAAEQEGLVWGPSGSCWIFWPCPVSEGREEQPVPTEDGDQERDGSTLEMGTLEAELVERRCLWSVMLSLST